MSALPQAVTPAHDALPRVLIVHGDPDWLLRVSQALRTTGLLVTGLNQPEEALDLLDEVRPDCIVVDGALPGAAGQSLCRKVREHPRHGSVPILMLAPQVDAQALADAHRCAASDLCRRHVDASVLAHRIRQILWVRTLERSLDAADPAVVRGGTPAGRFEWFSQRSEVRGNEEFFRLLDQHHTDLSSPVDQATLLDHLSASDRRRLKIRLARLLAGGPSFRPEVEVRTRSSGSRRIRIEIHQVHSTTQGERIVSGQVQDVTPAAGSAAQLYRLTHYDALTGLPNRTWLIELLRSGPRPGAKGLGLAILDIDRFSEVTEAYGQQAADRLIVEVAQRLRRIARADRPQAPGLGAGLDATAAEGLAHTLPVEARPRSEPSQVLSSDGRIAAVAYLGGNEFALILEDVPGTDEALSIGRNALTVLSEPFRLDDRELFLRISMGVHVGDPTREDAVGWIGRAELARRAAGADGGNQVRSFEAGQSDQLTDRLVMERDLHYALARNELAMYLQPKVDGRTGRIIGFEALMRWVRHGIHQSPARFIPLAEETGLIVPLGEWAIDQACAALARLSLIGETDSSVAVNLSARQLRGERLARVVADALSRHAVAAHRLEVELTESGLMQDPEQAVRDLQQIRELGVGLAVDDFGTGYSSLAYLTRLPLTTLKIDRSFIRDVHVSDRSRAVAGAVVGLGANLQLQVVAEGVELQEQRNELLRLGCSIHQGYLYGKALPLMDALALVDRSASALMERSR